MWIEGVPFEVTGKPQFKEFIKRKFNRSERELMARIQPSEGQAGMNNDVHPAQL
jgi:hypothetical protein